VVRKGGNGGK
jgi:hypothetical protein